MELNIADMSGGGCVSSITDALSAAGYPAS